MGSTCKLLLGKYRGVVTNTPTFLGWDASKRGYLM